jgi:glutamate-1-semialdehyde 2,1-aminomutase
VLTAGSVIDALGERLGAVEARFAAANPRSLAQHERARRVLPAGHSRQTLLYPPFPVTVVGGKGARFHDLDGHAYLNLVGDFAAGVYGHTPRAIQAAVRAASEAGVFLSGVNTKEVELAELITGRIPSIEQIRFCNSGSEACLYAALLARHATQRPKLMVFRGCYHGGFMIWGDAPAGLTVPFDVVTATYNDVEGTRALLRQRAEETAAVLVEPVLGSGGCIPGSREFLSMLREETERLGVLLVFDEVMTSRLGPGGVQGLVEVRPDLTTLGKFWGGGFSFGAFGGRRDLMQHFDTTTGGQLSQAGTFNNNVMSMSAGLVGARDLYTPDACRHLNELGEWLRAALNDVARARRAPLQLTGLGAVMNFHWHDRPIRHPGDAEASNSRRRRLFQLEMLLEGFYVAQRGLVTLSLEHTRAQLAEFVDAVERYLQRHGQVLRECAP